MSAELITPTDELTGIPLSVAPPLEFLPRNNPDITNWHHLWHPSTAPELETLGGWALRNSRIQLLPIHDHNTGKHNYHTMFTGPPLPPADDEDMQFKLCVLSCAGYLPQEVIDIKGDVPERRQMKRREREFFLKQPTPQGVSSQDIKRYKLKFIEDNQDEIETVGLPTNRQIHQILTERNERHALLSYNNFRYAYDPIREFFTDYALRKQPDIKEIVIDEFLHTTNTEKRKYLGHLLLAKKSETAADAVQGMYKVARIAGSLHPLMPAHPASLVKYKLGNAETREALFPKLENILLNAA